MNFIESNKLNFPAWRYHWHEESKIFQNQNDFDSTKNPEEWFDCPRKAYLFRYIQKITNWTPCESACLLSGIDPRKSKDLIYKDINHKTNDLKILINNAIKTKSINLIKEQ